MQWELLFGSIAGTALITAVLTVLLLRRRYPEAEPAPSQRRATLVGPDAEVTPKATTFRTAQMWGMQPRHRTPTAPAHRDCKVWRTQAITDEFELAAYEDVKQDMSLPPTDKFHTPRPVTSELASMREALAEFALGLEENPIFGRRAKTVP